MGNNENSRIVEDCKQWTSELIQYIELKTVREIATIEFKDSFLDIGVDLNLIDHLVEILKYLDTSPDVSAILFTLGVDCFSPEKVNTFWEKLPDEYVKQDQFIHRLEFAFYRIIKMNLISPKPRIIAMQGDVSLSALGLALSCDYRIINSSTIFHNCSRTLNIPLGGGVIYFLKKNLGLGQAKKLLLKEEPIDGTSMKELGIVDEILEGNDLDELSVKVASRFSQIPDKYFKTIKKELNRSFLDVEKYFNKEADDIFKTLDHNL